MSYVPLRTFPDAAQQASIWVCELADRLGCEQREAYEVLRLVLHGLRDSMEALDQSAFANHLPVLLCGIFYANWHPATPRSDHYAASQIHSQVGARLNCSGAQSRHAVAELLKMLDIRLNPHNETGFRALLQANSQWLLSTQEIARPEARAGQK